MNYAYPSERPTISLSLVLKIMWDYIKKQNRTHIQELWRSLINQIFVTLPGYPRALSLFWEWTVYAPCKC